MNKRTLEAIKNATIVISRADDKLISIKRELQEIYNIVQFRINSLRAQDKNPEETDFLEGIKKSISAIARTNCPVS